MFSLEPTGRLKAAFLGTALATAAIGPFTSTALAQANDALVIEAGRIVIDSETEIEDGVLVIEGGRIAKVGKRSEVEVPWDAQVLGGPEFTAFPGFVEAYSARGMDRANESIDVAPFLDVQDSIDPINVYFQDCLRWGITSINVQQGADCVIGGRGRLVKPVGITIDQMTVRPHFGLVLSADPKRGKSRATQAQALRESFSELHRYLEDLVGSAREDADLARREAKAQGRELEGEDAEGRAFKSAATWSVDGLELVPRGAIDEKQAPLLDLVEGRTPAFIHCGGPHDVHIAIDVARENGFLERTTLVLQPACWKAADVIVEAGVDVVHTGSLIHRETDPVTGDETETFVLDVYRDKGISFSLSSQNSSTTSLWYQAARAIGHGLTRAQAIDSVTIAPARALGLEAHVGSLQTGRLGNVVLFSGDPLATTTWVEHVIVEGEHVYDRSKDPRNRILIEGEDPFDNLRTDG
ncbi:N-ethylammeline chlorohydrolase [Planctomycetes bacterium Pla163]|uniref:N-ethylammeline chlorohydrolase n=1 Tax=Rohdeia mirabilis TaxID=2528008 RepID=A0A518CV30_9BACT|nr:N-ethylammeline chlorohydrolase [Planctomycetes bacterium Pla163]